MKRLPILFLMCLPFTQCKTQTRQLLPDYNTSYYPTVLQAAEGVGMPFLLMQRYKTMTGVTVKNDSLLDYDGNLYAVHGHYLNPTPTFDNGYYVQDSNYGTYNISAAEKQEWPYRIPYALYDGMSGKFNGTIDCVGYGTRLLAATGSANPDSNAYMMLMSYMHAQNVSPFAFKGYVASAYEIAAALPTLPVSVQRGWQYVAGNVETHTVDSLNHAMKGHNGLKMYSGVSKGGVAQAQPGDILSFGYAPGKGANGHFMVLEQQPQLLDSAALAGYYKNWMNSNVAAKLDSVRNALNVYAVPLYDCSGDTAHFNDSRKYMSGIGHGTLLLLADKATDVPMGFIFEPPRSTPFVGVEYMGEHVVAISIGRFKP
ncbi:hypothetical protein ACTHGU_08905 [Chitinophagaceae bacterium MMS25-I14]